MAGIILPPGQFIVSYGLHDGDEDDKQKSPAALFPQIARMTNEGRQATSV
jgi:hypothetical protein